MLSVIIPTFNEKGNLAPLCERIDSALKTINLPHEIIIVDDNSPDGTAETAQSMANTYPIKTIKRLDKRGLGSAIIDGITSAQGKIICVMDADLSHPPEAIPEMYKIITSGKAQMVIGSRYVKGGGTSEWIWYRKIIGLIAKACGSFLTPVKDVTSGFFMFDKKIIEGVKLEPRSWKIGLEIIVKSGVTEVIEYPIVFIERESGQSKMELKEAIAYLLHLAYLVIHKMKQAIGNREQNT
ncbi:MAG: polyprenol monophosphomannose synthase [Candidatus Margulisbacteria bacterium]|nr:polyprenol monophosphomannose synthase [Candidatus Margulisiibacteriota bacterium]